MDYLVEMQDSEEVRARVPGTRASALPRFADVNSWIIGFNMLDPVIGWGDTPEQRERNRKLRQAISIAIDWEEYSKIFPKKAGETAMSPLPQGIFGSRHGTPEGVNPVTHKLVDGKVVRRTIEEAKQLLAEAGYPNGRDAKTGKPLVINYDYYARADARAQARDRLGGAPVRQARHPARGARHRQQPVPGQGAQGQAPGVLAGLAGRLSRTPRTSCSCSTARTARRVSDGENTANYANPEFDKLFAQLKLLDDGPEKQAVIDRMVAHRCSRTRRGASASFPTPRARPSPGCTTTSRRC